MPIVGDRPEISVNAVVFATDFSTCSENAGNYARLLAGHFAASLLVTHAFLLTQAAMEVETGQRKTSRQREDLLAQLTQKANALSSGTLKAVPVLLEGNPHQVIPALAEKHAPALIVLGTHGAGIIEHELIGSVAEKILRSTRWPCLTVGPRAPRTSAGTLPFRRILYATDLSPAAAHAAVYALTFAEAAGSDLDVLNVIPENFPEDPNRAAELEKHYYHALDQLAPQHVRDFCNPHTFVKTGKAHDRILAHIVEHSVDLLVLGIRKSSHLGLEMRTSGAFRLIADAPCPVLTITG
ncbi:MAG: universal stress protein [Acidobacteriota bacterium]|nr:universal stress protein [Acidobacteriota bacterium]